jgi:hypothetical protein
MLDEMQTSNTAPSIQQRIQAGRIGCAVFALAIVLSII